MSTELASGGEVFDSPAAVAQADGAPPPRPPRVATGSFWRFIHDRNPFYLLSAVCMFAGYRMILGAMNTAPGDVGGVIPLIAVLNLYEFALIGLALFLIRRRGLVRDGWFLLIIQALFLVDLTNLQSEIFTASLSKGLLINGICYFLALVKIGIVLKGLRLNTSPGEKVFIAASLFVLFGVAGAFKGLSQHGALDPRLLHAGWWIAGALVALLGLIPHGVRLGRMAGVPVRLYLLIPLASIIVHLCGANRVYSIDFHIASLTPILLGLAVALQAAFLLPRSAVAKLQLTLMVFAIGLSLHDSSSLSFSAAGLWLSPMRLTLLAACAVSILAFMRHRRPIFACFAAACAVTASLGHTLEGDRQTLAVIARFLVRAGNAMIPTTPMGWGIVAVIASFILLAVGALFSLRKGPTGFNE